MSLGFCVEGVGLSGEDLGSKEVPFNVPAFFHLSVGKEKQDAVQEAMSKYG